MQQATEHFDQFSADNGSLQNRDHKRCAGLAGVCGENKWDTELSEPYCYNMAGHLTIIVVQDRRRHLQLISNAKSILGRSWCQDVRTRPIERPAKVVLGIGVALDHKDRETHERRMFQEVSFARGNALEPKAPFTKDGC
jgi:hypothetical protein